MKINVCKILTLKDSLTYSKSSFCSRFGIDTLTVSLGCLLPEIRDMKALELAENIQKYTCSWIKSFIYYILFI